MPSILRSSLRGLTALALAATGLLSCDSPTGPKPDPFTLTLGRSAEGTVTGADSLTYHLHVTAGQLFIVFVEARDSGIVATVLDPRGYVAGQSLHSGPRPSGAYSAWQMVEAPIAGDYTVQVRAAGPGLVGGTFELRPEAVHSAPESTPVLIQPNDTIATEALDQAGDVDDFEFDGQVGEEVNLFLQSLAPTTEALHISLSQLQPAPYEGTNPNLGGIGGRQRDEDFEFTASGTISLPVTGRYRVRIASLPTGSTSTARVPYRFLVYRINRAPEHLPDVLAVGDTVSEAIDMVGDIDEYTISGAPGSMFNVFADAGGSAPHRAVVSILNGGASAPAVIYARPGEKLLDKPSGTFTLPAWGSITVRVQDEASNNGLHRGPYRLFVYPIDRTPEGQSSQIVPSAAPVSGAIEQYGDIDEYSFTVTSPTMISLRANVPISRVGGLSIAIDGQTSFIGDAASASLAAGTYHLRVIPHGAGASGTFRGPYQFVLAPADTATENVLASVAVGDTVRRETLSWPLDVDRFHLASSGADTVVIERSRPSSPGSTQTLSVLDGQTGAALFTMYNDSITTTPRIDLAAGGGATVVMQQIDPGWAPGTQSPYELVVKRVSAAPEHRSASIAIGDSVTEAFDFSGDIDDYILRGTPGQYINLSAGWPVGQGPRGLSFQLLDPGTGAQLNTASGLSVLDSPAIPIPAGGEVRVRACVTTNCGPQVCQPGSCQLPTHILGTYWFIVHSVNTAPEVIPASFAIGDTVSGEKLEAKGDIDEFHFNGTAGQHISAQFQWLSGYYGGEGSTGLQLQIIDATTGDVLGTIYDERGATQLGDIALAPTVLPSTGPYVVRVQAHWTAAWGWLNVGPYRFRVVTEP